MGSPDPPEVETVNPGKAIKQYVRGMRKALPSILETESKYRDDFTALNNREARDTLAGTNGILDLQATATSRGQDLLESSRNRELAYTTSQAGAARGLLGAISPESQQAANRASQMAETAFLNSGALTPEQARSADQTARESFASRGRINDNASVVGEILNREESLAGKRAEASELGQAAFGMQQQFTAPALGILGGTPASVGLGTSNTAQAMGQIGNATPKLIDTGAALNLAATNTANRNQANIAAYQGQQSQTNGYLEAGASVLGAAMMFSDERVKTDKKVVGKTKGGLPISTFRYKGSPQTIMGVMAQDVKKKTPGAVKNVGGILAVDYAKVR